MAGLMFVDDFTSLIDGELLSNTKGADFLAYQFIYM
jgi:hypothetical protein